MKCYVFSMCVRLNNGFLLCCFVCFSFIITCDPVPLWLVRAATKFDFTYLLTFIDNETYDDQHNDGKSIPNRFWMCGFSHSDRMRMYDFFSTNFMFFFFGKIKVHSCFYVWVWGSTAVSTPKCIQKLVYFSVAGGARGRDLVLFSLHNFRAFDFLIPKRPFRCLPVRNRQNSFIQTLVGVGWVEAPGPLQQTHCYKKISTVELDMLHRYNVESISVVIDDATESVSPVVFAASIVLKYFFFLLFFELIETERYKTKNEATGNQYTFGLCACFIDQPHFQLGPRDNNSLKRTFPFRLFASLAFVAIALRAFNTIGLQRMFFVFFALAWRYSLPILGARIFFSHLYRFIQNSNSFAHRCRHNVSK